MNKVIISSDSCLDEFKTILKEQNIKYMPMVYIIDDKEYRDEFDTQEEYDEFYSKMKEGAMPTTSMLNSYEMEEYFEGLLQEEPNADILHIALSSGLSGTYDNTRIAGENIMKKYPKNKIFILDGLSASLGQNSLVKIATAERDKGMTAEDIFNKLQELKHNMQHLFIIDNLFHLKRGGRISGAKAVIGTMLQTKPILTFNNEGKIDINSKALGFKKAIKMIADKLEPMGCVNEPQDIYIAHADCKPESELLKRFILKRFDKVNVIIKNLGPVIGSHTGPGALGVGFMGKERPKAKKAAE
jgi:DegV family protein with EDD domain